MSETPRREITVKRHNIECLWSWFDALRRRDTEAMAAALDRDIVWQGARPDLVCHGPDEVIEAFLVGYDRDQEIASLELLGGDPHIVLGVRAPDLAINEVDTDGEIYNVFTIEGHKIKWIEDYLEREAALAAAGITAPPRPRRVALATAMRPQSASPITPMPRRSANCSTTSTPSSTSRRQARAPSPIASGSSSPAGTPRCSSAERDRTDLRCFGSAPRSGPMRWSAPWPNCTSSRSDAVTASDGR
jgi:hypothetical protein